MTKKRPTSPVDTVGVDTDGVPGVADGRRALLRAPLLCLPVACLPARSVAQPADGAPDTPRPSIDWGKVEPGRALVFPRDFGAHPAFRTEWWYITGWLEREGAAPCGFQVTFFRSRTPHDPANPSRFAPRQLLFAHAALALPERGRLLHAQRSARAGFGLAEASEATTDVRMGAWRLWRRDMPSPEAPFGRYDTTITDPELEMALTLRPVAPPLLQGDAGFSRKGPRPDQSSHYYSEPQLRVEGRIGLPDAPGRPPRTRSVRGSAWLDHEWSTTLLDRDAAGWDWLGLNLHDGGSLTAFRIRDRAGGTHFTHGSWADAAQRRVTDADPVWRPLREWTSPRSGARYPVVMEARIGGATLVLEPLMDDQEVDARASTGGFYWEGAVRVMHRGREIGRGYMELTGYADRVRL